MLVNIEVISQDFHQESLPNTQKITWLHFPYSGKIRKGGGILERYI